jgi:hypothetical protein
MKKLHILTRLPGDNLKFDNYEPPFGFLYNAAGIIKSGNAEIISVSESESNPSIVNADEEFNTYLQSVIFIDQDKIDDKEFILNEVAKDLAHSNHGTYVTGNNKMQVVAFDYIHTFPDLK